MMSDFTFLYGNDDKMKRGMNLAAYVMSPKTRESIPGTDINEDSEGVCLYAPGDTCTPQSTFSIVTTDPNVDEFEYEWTTDDRAYIVGDAHGPTVVVSTIGGGSIEGFTVYVCVRDDLRVSNLALNALQYRQSL